MDPIFYTIGGKEFYQDQASAWQKAHVAKLIGGKDVAQFNASAIMDMLGPDGLLDFYAILLVPKGISKEEFIKQRMIPGSGQNDRLTFAAFVDEALTLEILADFLAFILEPSNMSRIQGALGRIMELIPDVLSTPSDKLNDKQPSLHVETQPVDMPSLP